MSQFGLRFTQGDLLLMQLFFCPLALRYVYDDRRVERGVVFTCGDEDAADIRPHWPAIFAQVALLDTKIP
jgi:hypothetical protein